MRWFKNPEILIMIFLTGFFFLISANESNSGHSELEPDSIIIGSKNKALDDITFDDLSLITYEELVALSFKQLLKLSELFGTSIDELLKLRVSVSSKAVSTVREQPNIITIITGEQIRKSGFHDLMSILRTVPGIFFGNDMCGVIGIGMRGIWAQEGKMLLLLDGQEMNELRYAGVPFFNHFDVNQIKRIEIIRGAGSSLWGGSAALGVINVITRDGADLNGFSLSTTGSYLNDTYGRANMSVAAGIKERDFEIRAGGFYGKAHRSDKLFRSFYYIDDDPELGFQEYDLSGYYGTTETKNANIAVGWRDFSARFIYDYYKQYGIDTEIYDNSFETYLGELQYQWSVLPEKLKITTKYNFTLSKPWLTKGYEGNERIQRHRLNLSGLWNPHGILAVSGGCDLYRDVASLLNDAPDYYFFNGKDTISFNNVNLFGELSLKLRSVNITAGSRVQYNNQYESAVAPRFGVNQVFGDFHYKVLLSKAYRSPDIGNLEISPEVKPEETFVVELESGYKINRFMFITANLFNIQVEKPIYVYENGTDWGYRNGKKQGAGGIELEYAFRHQIANATLNYSYYQAHKNSDIALYKSFIDERLYLGAPQHKVSMWGYIDVTRFLTFSLSANLFSTTYGYFTTREERAIINGEDITKTVPEEGWLAPSALLNIGVTWKPIRGLMISCGVSDVFDRGYPFIQPYNGFEAPIPGQGREIYMKLTYSYKLNR